MLRIGACRGAGVRRCGATHVSGPHPGPTATFKERIVDFAESVRNLPVQDLVSSLSPRPPAPSPAGHAAFHGHAPSVPASCYVSPAATLIGDLVLGEDCSVWPGAVLR